MAVFKRLTYDEALTFTRGELLDRLMVESDYWTRKVHKGRMTEADWDAHREFGRILRLIDVGEALAEARRVVSGEKGSYWAERPTEVPT